MQAKPTVDIWVLGGSTYFWYQRLASTSGYPPEGHSVESEIRSYRLLRAPWMTACRANILLLSLHEAISPTQRALLLLAGYYTKELAVIICRTKDASAEYRDQKEKSTRDKLAELGYQANDVFFYHEPDEFPSSEAVSAVLAALDQRDLSRETSLDLKPFPDGPDRLRAELYRLIKSIASPAVELSLKKGMGDQLSTRFGDIPYLEQGEEWPFCTRCKRKVTRFVFQLNAAQDLTPPIDGAGLFVFYSCGAGYGPKAPHLTIRHYASPSKEKALPRRSEVFRKATSTKPSVAMSALLKRPFLQGPSLRELEAISDLESYKESSHAKIFRLLSPLAGIEPERLSYEGVYEQALAALDASEVEPFIFGGERPLQIGGHCDFAKNAVSPQCPQCKQVMRLLAHIHSVEGFASPFADGALQLFICPCTPTNIIVKDRVETEDERYSREYE